MRIVCPRCVAQYEVDESAIPEAGREVQCANCENIWFQDYIEMLPTEPGDEDVTLEEDQGVFDDLEGKSDAGFYSNRGANAEPEPESGPPEEDPLDHENILAEDEDDFDDIDDDDEPATNIPVPPLDDDVRDVLRSEAAFSSARDVLDAAASDALDGDGEALKAALDDTASLETPDEDIDLDDLSAFLDAHADDGATPAPPAEPEPEEAPDEEPSADPDFDPLADLNAIRSQLDNIGADMAGDDDATEYTPVLPADDPQPEPDDLTFSESQIDDLEHTSSDDTETKDAEEDEIEYDDLEDVLASTIASATSTPEVDDELEDDLEEDQPRHAYRADGGSAPTTDDDIEDEDQEEDNAQNSVAAALAEMSNADDDAIEDVELPEDSADARPVAAAAAAVGLSRPRPKGTRARARTLPGFDAVPEKTETPDIPDDIPADDLTNAISGAIKNVEKDTDLLDDMSDANEIAAETKTRPSKADRKAMLPDVDELDASLRSEGDEPRRRDREMMEAHEDELAKAGKGGFRRAFIWTLFVVALLIALYVMRPQLVAAVPAAAVVLDPYASIIDSIRGVINGLLG